VGIAGAFVGYHIEVLLALGGGLLMSVIASAAGAAVVLFAWRRSNERGPGREFVFKTLGIERHRKACTTILVSARDVQFAANLPHQRLDDFHSESPAADRIELRRQSRPVVRHR
jgi:Flp pilus assembly protein CpaB